MQQRPSAGLTRASWVSLFAMLMIFIGPLISQSMPMDQRAPSTLQGSVATDAATLAHAEHGAHSANKDAAQQADHHALWEKCGYCSLLYNCPALTGSPSFFTEKAPLAHRITAAAIRLGHARQPVFPGARTRAPPIVA